MKNSRIVLWIVSTISLSLFVRPAQCFNVSDVFTFAKGYIKHPLNVGSPFPCSSSVGYELATHLIRYMKENTNKPLRILEVGAGTGSITQVLVRILRPIDHLDVIEISSDYCVSLQKKFGAHSTVSIHCISFIDWNPGYEYDFIISTLPLNSFDHELLNATIHRFKQLIKQGGVLSYVAIAGIAHANKYLLWGKAKKEHTDNMQTLKQFRDQYQIRAATVLASCPPIRVYHLRISS